MRYKSLVFRDFGAGTSEQGRMKREEGRGKREEGRGKREEGRGKREEGKNNVYLIAMINAIV
ncbi:MAG: hypothetical protein F6K50_01225 [Moorea sp. SIO3I7]|nr:hypothetical protein [Moorena sp. SIO3I7]